MEGTTNNSTLLTDLGSHNLENVTSVFSVLNINEGLIQDPVQFRKIKDIVTFMDESEDAGFLIRKIIRRSPASRSIDHVWTFVELSKQKNSLLEKMDKSAFDFKKKELKSLVREIDKELEQY